MKNRWIRPLCLGMALVLMSGCQSKATSVSLDEVSIREAVVIADPQKAIQDIYETLPDAQVEPLDQDLFEHLFPNLSDHVITYVGAISEVSGGLADVIVLQTHGDKTSRELAREGLRQYQDKRILEFQNYDILDSYTIATEGQVFDQGEFVILLMVPDLEEAREIIDQYLPL